MWFDILEIQIQNRGGQGHNYGVSDGQVYMKDSTCNRDKEDGNNAANRTLITNVFK